VAFGISANAGCLARKLKSSQSFLNELNQTAFLNPTGLASLVSKNTGPYMFLLQNNIHQTKLLRCRNEGKSHLIQEFVKLSQKFICPYLMIFLQTTTCWAESTRLIVDWCSSAATRNHCPVRDNLAGGNAPHLQAPAVRLRLSWRVGILSTSTERYHRIFRTENARLPELSRGWKRHLVLSDDRTKLGEYLYRAIEYDVIVPVSRDRM